ncbi:MAG TPA: CoA pyrophosphatase [Flavobacterium sp.]|jgi:8-oxo-dGTP pyrophosphatase MutT (NUDIX family)
MDFQEFLNCIPKVAKESLPGEDAHLKMAPPERKTRMAELDHALLNPRKAAVLMLVYPRENRAHLALILRNTYNGVHSSQIAFPGGKVESSDPDYGYTALRETHEEVGIPPEAITLVKAFTEVYIPPSNFMVFPFLGYTLTEPQFIEDPAEVAGMVELPLESFLDDRIIVDKQMDTSYSKSIFVPAFKIGEHHVWGATAMILSELKEVLQKAL